MTPTSKISFGCFEVDVRAGELRKQGRRVPLAPQPVRLLALLASTPGELVTREEIRRALWGEETFVDFEHGLNFCIRRIRAALGDDARNPRFVETLPRRGYRFMGAVDNGVPAAPAAGEPPPEAWEHYSRARKSFAQFGMTSLEEARQGFHAAIALDPEYALAHSGLGATYSLRNIFRRDAADLEKARLHLETAVRLDAELAEPWPWLCYVYGRGTELPRAIEAGRRGVELQPDFVHAQYFLGLAYFISAESDPAQYANAATHLLRATEVNPNWQASWFVLSSLSLLNGLYDDAERFGRRLLEGGAPPSGLSFIGAEMILASVALRRRDAAAARAVAAQFLAKLEDSDHMYRDSMRAVTSCVLGDVELRYGSGADALAAYRKAWHFVQENPRMMAHQRIRVRVIAGMAAAYAATGDRPHAESLLDSALAVTEEAAGMKQAAAGASLADTLYGMATAYARIGNAERAIGFLQRAVAGGWRDAAWIAIDPELEGVRGDVRAMEAIEELRAPVVTLARSSVSSGRA